MTTRKTVGEGWDDLVADIIEWGGQVSPGDLLKSADHLFGDEVAAALKEHGEAFAHEAMAGATFVVGPTLGVDFLGGQAFVNLVSTMVPLMFSAFALGVQTQAAGPDSLVELARLAAVALGEASEFYHDIDGYIE